MGAATEQPRRLDPQWDGGLIAASIAVSLLGALTSTQLMCQARMSLQISSIAVWTALGSLTFGFCSIWCLHFVAMLACKLDLPIGINVSLTILSAILAVFFTFVALASDLLWEKFRASSRKRRRVRRTRSIYKDSMLQQDLSEPLMSSADGDADSDTERSSTDDTNSRLEPAHQFEDLESPATTIQASPPRMPAHSKTNDSKNTSRRHSSVDSVISEQSSTITSVSHGSSGLRDILNIAYQTTAPAKNAFVATGERVYSGCTTRNIIKGFLWSLAITSMHYVGILALRIPQGYATFNPLLVILSAVISWVVCLVGCILISKIETNLSHQLLFAAVASTGVAAMHFTGMRVVMYQSSGKLTLLPGMSAVTFRSSAPPSQKRGYPPALAVAIVSIAISTCIVANFLLAHVATVSRNKLAEIVWTRKELWRTIAQKENAEAAAAARSDFIASASHEIRTPLHHLQGYSDLLSRTELTEEGRMLLYAIQHATKSLSLSASYFFTPSHYHVAHSYDPFLCP